MIFSKSKVCCHFLSSSHLPLSLYDLKLHSLGSLPWKKTKKIPCQPVVSADANPRVLAAQVAMTRSSLCRLQPPRACCPPAYLTWDQRGELCRSRISAVAATKVTKAADHSRDDDNNEDKEEVQSIGKKGDDGGDEEQGVKEGGVLAAAKAAKPGDDDS